MWLLSRVERSESRHLTSVVLTGNRSDNAAKCSPSVPKFCCHFCSDQGNHRYSPSNSCHPTKEGQSVQAVRSPSSNIKVTQCKPWGHLLVHAATSLTLAVFRLIWTVDLNRPFKNIDDELTCILVSVLISNGSIVSSCRGMINWALDHVVSTFLSICFGLVTDY